VAAPPVAGWPKEEIPDIDRLFMRVHRNFVSQGKLAPGVFRDHGMGMSTDWERYSTAAETLQRAAEPSKNGVIQLVAGSLRAIEGLTVEHTPIIINRAHTDVFGEKTTEVRLRLKREAQWVILVNEPV
jgi:hypothetical protein